MTKTASNPTDCPSCGAKASGKFCNKCGASLAPGTCRHCSTPLPPGARFCNECGTSTAGYESSAIAGPQGPPLAAGGSAVAAYMPWGLAVIALISVAAYFVGRNNDTAAPTTVAAEAGGAGPVAPFAAGGAGGAAPDINSMSPRERASRLYDRIMRYTEQGKKDSAEFFAPMALASFEMLGADLDTDARYDYGRVASETGRLEIAAAQADTILKQNPTHLLGLALRARTASTKGDAKAAAATWKAFMAARDAEMKKSLPEYQMHATDIEQATALAKGGK